MAVNPARVGRGRPGRLAEVVRVDETYLKVRGKWAYLYRAVDRDGNLIDAMLSEHRDMAATKAFFRSAKATICYRPHRVTTDGHGSYPKAIRTTLGRTVWHRTSADLNNRLEQDHRGIKGRIRCMRGFKSDPSAARFCREHGELRDLLRCRRRHNQPVCAATRRSRFTKAAQLVLDIMQGA
jgi:putative transposase